MKIVFIGGRDIRKLGGIENYMYNLATELKTMGHEPVVFCESDHNGEETINGFRVIHQKGPENPLICKPWLGLKATVKTIRSIKDADMIHFNAWPPSLWSPLARVFGIKTVMQGHGFEWQRSKYSKMQRRILHFMEWLTAHINRNLIMCSEDQTLYFKAHYHRDAVTIPTAVNEADLTIDNDSDILEKFGLRPGEYFLFLARLVQDKNPDYLIKAFHGLSGHNVKLVIAGNNPADPKYVEYLHSLGEGDENVVFTDAVYGRDKDKLLRNAFAFCLPSTIEGLSISLLEAMNYKLPIVATDIPSNREVLTDDSAFWAVPEDEASLKSALEQCLIHTGDMQEGIKRNYDLVVNNYTWHSVARRYVETLGRLR